MPGKNSLLKRLSSLKGLVPKKAKLCLWLYLILSHFLSLSFSFTLPLFLLNSYQSFTAIQKLSYFLPKSWNVI